MIAQIILDSLIKDRKSNLAGKIIHKLFTFLRIVYLKINKNTLVTYNLEGSKIHLPFKHDLPLNKKLFPLYDTNIGRLAGYLKEKYIDFQAIDIGANIGDTAIIIKRYIEVPILCIEADKYYYKLLIQNTTDLKTIDYENCFVGESKSNDLVFVNYSGSGRIVKKNESASNIEFSSLTDIIKRHPNFNNVKYLKIDTDGFDCTIIRSNADFLKQYKPVVFFEYDPYFLGLIDDDGLSVFNTLRDIGYEKLIIYDNTGDFLISLSLGQTTILEELNLYYTGKKGDKYMDICIFHSEDSDLADKIRIFELEFYRNVKVQQ
ncbi:MAG TPA: FkbM family methyltransferase [Ignavibacteriaceae bacterium]|nr:FkbM family methyltransferase [Ignavibacteriaceae bacterium]